jgi:hypothetical protein
MELTEEQFEIAVKAAVASGLNAKQIKEAILEKFGENDLDHDILERIFDFAMVEGREPDEGEV